MILRLQGVDRLSNFRIYTRNDMVTNSPIEVGTSEFQNEFLFCFSYWELKKKKDWFFPIKWTTLAIILLIHFNMFDVYNTKWSGSSSNCKHLSATEREREVEKKCNYIQMFSRSLSQNQAPTTYDALQNISISNLMQFTQNVNILTDCNT